MAESIIRQSITTAEIEHLRLISRGSDWLALASGAAPDSMKLIGEHIATAGVLPDLLARQEELGWEIYYQEEGRITPLPANDSASLDVVRLLIAIAQRTECRGIRRVRPDPTAEPGGTLPTSAAGTGGSVDAYSLSHAEVAEAEFAIKMALGELHAPAPAEAIAECEYWQRQVFDRHAVKLAKWAARVSAKAGADASAARRVLAEERRSPRPSPVRVALALLADDGRWPPPTPQPDAPSPVAEHPAATSPGGADDTKADGPFEPFGFHLGGFEVHDLSPDRYRLLRELWDFAKGRPRAAVEEAHLPEDYTAGKTTMKDFAKNITSDFRDGGIAATVKRGGGKVWIEPAPDAAR